MKNKADNNNLSMFSKETLDSLEMAEVTGGLDSTNVGCINIWKCKLTDEDCLPPVLPNLTCTPNLAC